MSTTCRSCDAEVTFVPSATSGKAMILDATPKKGIVLTDRRVAMPVLLPDPAQPEAHVVDVYTDHHATCPQAAAWKQKAKGA